MANVIPVELRNRSGLEKMKSAYAEYAPLVGENDPKMFQLREDIAVIEHELEEDEPLFATAAAASAARY